MGSMLKIEIRRGLFNKGMLLSLLLGAVIAITHVFFVVLPLLEFQDNYRLNVYKAMDMPFSVFGKWLGGEGYSLQNYLYFLLLPLLATLPYADSYFTDRKSGYVKNIYTRAKKSHFLGAKYLCVFLCGGLAVILPAVLNLGLTAVFLPSLLPQATTSLYGIDATAVFADLFFSHPYVYILFYLIIIFLFAGFIATIALAISFFVENRFIVMLSPFLIYLFVYSLCSLTGMIEINPLIIFNPNQWNSPHSSLGIQMGEIVGLGLITSALFLGKGLHDDTY